MTEKYLFPEWKSQHENGKYPFSDNATLTNGVDVISRSIFMDARLFVIGGGARQYLGKIVRTTEDASIVIMDESDTEIAAGTVTFDGAQDKVELLDPYDRPAGVLVSTTDQLATLASWTAGTHTFTIDQTEFTATVVTPQPQIGVRGFLVEGKLFAGDVYMVGEQGVFLTMDGEFIRVDIVGDPLARQRFCEQLFNFDQPWFLRTINGYESDKYGDFKIISGGQVASDTVLRVEPRSNGIGLKLIGKILNSAPD
jgi:hypothetical protein